MSALGINPVALQTLPTQTARSAPALPKPAAPTVPYGNSADVSFDPQVAEQKRYEAVQKQAQDVANVYVVSDRTFSIFKDASGQYITRFTSLRDGRVTYIPEPELFRLGGGAGSQTVSIKA